MKYLKTYEDAYDDINNLKKYFIWKDPNINTYNILKFSHFKHGGIYVDFLYYYENNKLKKHITTNNYVSTNFSYIKYSSDDLQDCINMLPIIIKSTKYNI